MNTPSIRSEVMHASEIMTHLVHTLPASMSTADALARFATATGVQRHNNYPLINESGPGIGIVLLSDVLRG